MISVLGTYPLDLLRSRMAFEVGGTRRRLVSVLLATWRATDVVAAPAGGALARPAVTGLRALYRGFLPTVAGIVPYAGISFFTYDTLKAFEQSSRSDSSRTTSPVTLRLLFGAIAGATAQTAAYPLDVVRRRMQVHGLPGAANLPVYTSMFAAARCARPSPSLDPRAACC